MYPVNQVFLGNSDPLLSQSDITSQMQILKQYEFDENVVSAGYLHDVVEDTSYEIEDIKDNFND